MTVFANIPFANYLLASNRQVKYLICVSCGAAFNFGLNLALIPRYSLTGAAMATVLTELMVFTLLIHSSRSMFSRAMVGDSLRILAANAALFVLLYFIKSTILVTTIFGIGGYPVFLVMCGALVKKDISHVRTLINAFSQKRAAR